MQEPIIIDIKLENCKPDSNNSIDEKTEIDFKKFNYSKTGIYRYYISQIASSNENVFPISNEKYEIMVEVTKENEEYKISVLKPFSKISNETKVEELVFNNKMKNTFITIKNTNTGKISEANEYFKYELCIEGNIGDTFNIIGQDEYITYNGREIKTNNKYTLTKKDDVIYLYLKHNQTITIGVSSEGEDKIYQIPVGTKYKLTQLNSRKVKTVINGDMVKEINGIVVEGENLINIVNEKNFDVAITGIFMNIYPFYMLIGLAIGIIVIILKVKKDVDYEEFE